MLADEAVKYISIQMGFLSGQEDSILSVLHAAQKKLESTLDDMPWFLRKLTSFDLNENPIPLPEDFLLEVTDLRLDASVFKSDGSPLIKKDLRDLGSICQGVPVYYSIYGHKLYVNPFEPISIRLYYYASDVLPSFGSTNLWLTHAPFVLIGLAGQMYAAAGEYVAKIPFFVELYQTSFRDLTMRTFRHDFTGVDLALGGAVDARGR